MLWDKKYRKMPFFSQAKSDFNIWTQKMVWSPAEAWSLYGYIVFPRPTFLPSIMLLKLSSMTQVLPSLQRVNLGGVFFIHQGENSRPSVTLCFTTHATFHPHCERCLGITCYCDLLSKPNPVAIACSLCIFPKWLKRRFFSQLASTTQDSVRLCVHLSRSSANRP